MRKRTWMLNLLFVMLAVIVGGCETWTKNNQEHGIRFGTDVAFYSKSSKTSDEISETGVRSTLVDQLLEQSQAKKDETSDDETAATP